jgi:integrase
MPSARKSGFPACLETASAKAGKRSRHAAVPGNEFRNRPKGFKCSYGLEEIGQVTRQDGAGRKLAETAGGWKRSLAEVLKEHNDARQDGAVASAATRDKRSDVLFAGFIRLREIGFRLDTVTSLRDKHIATLMKDWHARGLSASTLQNNLSIFRTFAEWIGKAGMVRGIEHYLGPGVAVRSSIARQDRSWSAKGIDLAAKIQQVRLQDPRVALQLELQAAFGLRAREAMQLRPHIADKGTFLSITHGTKGGRDRVEPIRTPQQRALLDRAKTLCATPSSSTSDPRLRLHQWKNHYYQVVRACGITRKDGITSHGLRHEYANNRYQDLTGSDSPVRGGAAVNEQTHFLTATVQSGTRARSPECPDGRREWPAELSCSSPSRLVTDDPEVSQRNRPCRKAGAQL